MCYAKVWKRGCSACHAHHIWSRWYRCHNCWSMPRMHSMLWIEQQPSTPSGFCALWLQFTPSIHIESQLGCLSPAVNRRDHARRSARHGSLCFQHPAADHQPARDIQHKAMLVRWRCEWGRLYYRNQEVVRYAEYPGSRVWLRSERQEVLDYSKPRQIRMCERSVQGNER